jgi:cytochrome c peroxidase
MPEIPLRTQLLLTLASVLSLNACAVESQEQQEPEAATTTQALTSSDGLAEAFQIFSQTFTSIAATQWSVGYAPNPALDTEKVGVGGKPLNGTALFLFNEERIDATLRNVPAGQQFDLWLVKNGGAGSAAPGAGDTTQRIGTFGAPNAQNIATLSATVGSVVRFDLDLVVITRAGQTPQQSVLASGYRTLFEKRFFRAREGLPMDPVSGPVASVETADALVGRGAQLFFNEAFSGNGRTCGTCHRAENNLTIDAAFIGKLPQTDPLFIAETNPALATLEDPALLRSFGLIRENLDGFEDPANKFVMRSVPHTFAMAMSVARSDAPFPPGVDGDPPDQRTGWSGDGSPGRGTLQEFTFGAIVQHFTKAVERRPGTDFRLPTQGELDALEAFQLFSGRQSNPRTPTITFSDAGAEAGKNAFLNSAACVACHREVVDQNAVVGMNFDTGVDRLSFADDLGLPVDRGFGTFDDQGNPGSIASGFGSGRFNVPPLVEAADTAPFFHNNAVSTIEDAVRFYDTPEFEQSPAAGFSNPNPTPQEVLDIAAYLRVINAAENGRQVRKRVQFVRDNRSAGNTAMLDLAIEDCDDAIKVLSERNLNSSAVAAIQNVRQTLIIAKANPDASRPAYLDHALVYLGLYKGFLFSSNPLDLF